MAENENKNFFDLIDNSKEVFLNIDTPVLEDNDSSLSLLDQTLTNEEIIKYLSLLNDSSFSLADELGIENNIKPCSSINSNATTISTQETNEFRESLLSPNLNEVDIFTNQLTNVPEKSEKNSECFKTSSPFFLHDISDTQNNQLDIANLEAHFNNFDSLENLDNNVNQNFNDFNTINETSFTNKMNQDLNLKNNLFVNQLNCYQNNYSNYSHTNQVPLSNFYPLNQMSSVQYNANKNTDNSQVSFIANNYNNSIVINGSNSSFNSNFNDSINFCEVDNCNTINNNLTSSNYAQNEFFTYTECRDTNCPYTYCSRYNPYINNFFSVKNQIKQNSSITNNFLSRTSINMNLIDNQIVFNKTKDQLSIKNQVIPPSSKKKTKRKVKNELVETSVICNETTDYTFYTIEENSQVKKKRGRKRKTEDLLNIN